MKRSHFRAHRNHENGAAMLEALLSILVLFLIIFGMLHVYYFYAAQFITDYAAIRGARSKAVGFSDYIAQRETKVNIIGASGKMIKPDFTSGTDLACPSERSAIEHYMVGTTYLEYENWYGNHSHWGNDPDTAKDNVNLIDDYSQHNTTLHMNVLGKNTNTVNVTTTFKDYSFFSAVMVQKFFFPDKIDIKGSASLADYSSIYLN